MPELDDMSLEELKRLSRDVEKAIASFEDRKRKEALKALEKVARDHGFSLGEVVGTPKRRSRDVLADPKFRNPSNQSETWSGRGRQPGWYKEAVAKGVSPEKMRA